MREKITADLKTAMKAGDRAKVDALRLINAGLKDKDIEARGAGKTLSEDDVLALLQKMIKSRQESLDIYEKNNRPELADKERVRDRGDLQLSAEPNERGRGRRGDQGGGGGDWARPRSRTWARSSRR